MFKKLDDATLELLLNVLNALHISAFTERIEFELFTRALMRSAAAEDFIASFYEQHPTLCEGRTVFGVRNQERGVG
jgi:hypothetical protein